MAYRIMRNIGWMVAAVLSLVCLALWVQLADLRETVSELRIQVETAKPLVKRSPANGNIGQKTSTAAVAGDSSTHAAGGIQIKSVSLASVLNDHPEYLAVWRKMIRRQILKDNQDMFSHLSLAPEKLERLKNMMVERRLSEMDAMDAATRNGIGFDASGMSAVRKQVQDQSDQEIASMLGPEDFSEWRHATAVQAYQTNEAVQDIVVDTRDMGVPMTDEQTWKLKDAFQASALESYGSNPQDPSTGLRPSEQDKLERAAQFLSPAQVQALR